MQLAPASVVVQKDRSDRAQSLRLFCGSFVYSKEGDMNVAQRIETAAGEYPEGQIEDFRRMVFYKNICRQ